MSSQIQGSPQSRRMFLAQAALLPFAFETLAASEAVAVRLRAAIIGHTGKGDYGHEHDQIFRGRSDVETVAVADPNPEGRAKAAARSKALRQYADYRQMLETEKPQLVSVAPRWTDQHYAMGKAVLESGAHLYSEKPFTQTLEEADSLLGIARELNLKIVVAHQMRLAPQILGLKKAIDGGLIGDLLEIRAHGKQDARSGGEDLIVLGTHLFDLMRFFAADPLWCTARILEKSREVTRADAKHATEEIGPIIGDDIFAQFAFPNNVNATFRSARPNQAAAGHWGIEMIGTKAAVRVLADINPSILIREHPKTGSDPSSENWQKWPGESSILQDKSVAAANRRVVEDWLGAIRQNKEPVCSGFNAMRAIEMAHAIFAAGLERTRISLPLKNRKHPLQ
jgi:predicted dehydrogenase